MDYYSEVCDTCIKPKNKYKHFKSYFHKRLAKCKHIKLAMKNPDINSIDKPFYAYIIQHNKKYDYYLTKCELILVFDEY